jgi:ribosomal protein S18 acetylase RimI-like enzyme
MKNLLLALCISISALSSQCSEVKILDYNESHKDAVMEIVFQDPYKFFCGSDAVTKGLLPEEFFMTENKKGMEAILNNPLQIKKVLIGESKVVGFAEICKSRDLSLESLKAMVEAQGFPFDENEALVAMPYLKRTNAECPEFALIECMAVSKEFRGKGYGRTLMKVALDEIKTLWPEIKQVRLDVNTTNEVARKLYESEGFVASLVQPVHLSIVNVIQYERSLN